MHAAKATLLGKNCLEVRSNTFCAAQQYFADCKAAAIGTKNISYWKQIWNSRATQSRPPPGPANQQSRSHIPYQHPGYVPIAPKGTPTATEHATQSRPPTVPPPEATDTPKKRGRPPKKDTERAGHQAASTINDRPQKKIRQESEHEGATTSTHRYPPGSGNISNATSPTALSSAGPESAPFHSTAGSAPRFGPALGSATGSTHPLPQPSTYPPSSSPSERMLAQATTTSERDTGWPYSFADASSRLRPPTVEHQNPYHSITPTYRQLPAPWHQQHASSSVEAQAQAAPGRVLAPRPPSRVDSVPPPQEQAQRSSGGKRMEQ